MKKSGDVSFSVDPVTTASPTMKRTKKTPPETLEHVEKKRRIMVLTVNKDHFHIKTPPKPGVQNIPRFSPLGYGIFDLMEVCSYYFRSVIVGQMKDDIPWKWFTDHLKANSFQVLLDRCVPDDLDQDCVDKCVGLSKITMNYASKNRLEDYINQTHKTLISMAKKTDKIGMFTFLMKQSHSFLARVASSLMIFPFLFEASPKWRRYICALLTCVLMDLSVKSMYVMCRASCYIADFFCDWEKGRNTPQLDSGDKFLEYVHYTIKKPASDELLYGRELTKIADWVGEPFKIDAKNPTVLQGDVLYAAGENDLFFEQVDIAFHTQDKPTDPKDTDIPREMDSFYAREMNAGRYPGRLSILREGVAFNVVQTVNPDDVGLPISTNTRTMLGLSRPDASFFFAESDQMPPLYYAFSAHSHARLVSNGRLPYETHHIGSGAHGSTDLITPTNDKSILPGIRSDQHKIVVKAQSIKNRINPRRTDICLPPFEDNEDWCKTADLTEDPINEFYVHYTLMNIMERKDRTPISVLNIPVLLGWGATYDKVATFRHRAFGVQSNHSGKTDVEIDEEHNDAFDGFNARAMRKKQKPPATPTGITFVTAMEKAGEIELHEMISKQGHANLFVNAYEFGSILLQILCTLDRFHMIAGFVHNDLHTSNILVGTPPASCVGLVYKGSTPYHVYRIGARALNGVPPHRMYVANIIDFGRATIALRCADGTNKYTMSSITCGNRPHYRSFTPLTNFTILTDVNNLGWQLAGYIAHYLKKKMHDPSDIHPDVYMAVFHMLFSYNPEQSEAGVAYKTTERFMRTCAHRSDRSRKQYFSDNKVNPVDGQYLPEIYRVNRQGFEGAHEFDVFAQIVYDHSRKTCIKTGELIGVNPLLHPGSIGLSADSLRCLASARHGTRWLIERMALFKKFEIDDQQCIEEENQIGRAYSKPDINNFGICPISINNLNAYDPYPKWSGWSTNVDVSDTAKVDQACMDAQKEAEEFMATNP